MAIGKYLNHLYPNLPKQHRKFNEIGLHVHLYLVYRTHTVGQPPTNFNGPFRRRKWAWTTSITIKHVVGDDSAMIFGRWRGRSILSVSLSTSLFFFAASERELCSDDLAADGGAPALSECAQLPDSAMCPKLCGCQSAILAATV